VGLRTETVGEVFRDLTARRATRIRERTVPRISYFFGISIAMYFDDHPPPHFHARYAGTKAQISIRTLEVIGGRLPPRAMGLVLEWASLHREELADNWELAREGRPLRKIAPLR
jgi:hypothetical protein